MSLSRLLFASVHSYLDPSSGAALATRDLLELLDARGVDCRVLTLGVLDYEQETALEEVLAPMGTPVPPSAALLRGGGSVRAFDLELDGVRLRLLPTASSRVERSPNAGEAAAYLDLAEQLLDRFAPQVLLTYGGQPVNRALMALARRRGIPVVFHLHNLAYADRALFVDVTAALVPSEFARRYYARHLGLESTAIPPAMRPDRVVADERMPQYVTFVNPQPAKGLTVFAQIAAELGRRRPEIPFLVVEGRGTSDWLARLPMDLSGLTNLNRMANTPDPRHFYGAARVLLVPSLIAETFGRVAAEALANGILVLASDRGALPEVLGDAGLIFALPDRCMPENPALPTPREVAPWIYAIEQLWDDPAFEAKHRGRASRKRSAGTTTTWPTATNSSSAGSRPTSTPLPIGMGPKPHHSPTNWLRCRSEGLSRKVFVGCSVSTEPADFAEFGAHRAPYETASEASGTDSELPATPSLDPREGAPWPIPSSPIPVVLSPRTWGTPAAARTASRVLAESSSVAGQLSMAQAAVVAQATASVGAVRADPRARSVAGQAAGRVAGPAAAVE